MESVCIAAVMGAMCILSFWIGARTGQKVVRNEPLEIPEMNPVKAIREDRQMREVQRERNRRDTILRNIENYDGTGLGQVDVPGK